MTAHRRVIVPNKALNKHLVRSLSMLCEDGAMASCQSML